MKLLVLLALLLLTTSTLAISDAGETTISVTHECPHDPCWEGDEVIFNLDVYHEGNYVTYTDFYALTSDNKHTIATAENLDLCVKTNFSKGNTSTTLNGILPSPTSGQTLEYFFCWDISTGIQVINWVGPSVSNNEETSGLSYYEIMAHYPDIEAEWDEAYTTYEGGLNGFFYERINKTWDEVTAELTEQYSNELRRSIECPTNEEINKVNEVGTDIDLFMGYGGVVGSQLREGCEIDSHVIEVVPKSAIECQMNSDCEFDEYCEGMTCKRLGCRDCQYVENHACMDYECCVDGDCSEVTEVCRQHECVSIEPSEPMVPEPSYTKPDQDNTILYVIIGVLVVAVAGLFFMKTKKS